MVVGGGGRERAWGGLPGGGVAEEGGGGEVRGGEARGDGDEVVLRWLIGGD